MRTKEPRSHAIERRDRRCGSMRVLHFTTEVSMPIEVDDCKVPIVVVLGVGSNGSGGGR